MIEQRHLAEMGNVIKINHRTVCIRHLGLHKSTTDARYEQLMPISLILRRIILLTILLNWSE